MGSFFLVLHPRIFANSFYNTVDIAFLAFYIISIYSLIRFLDNKTYRNSILHALACAILIDIRVAGLILPITTLLLCFIEFYYTKDKSRLLKIIFTYSLSLLLLTYLFWPYLWSDPVNNFITAFNESRYVKHPQTVWDYNFVWIFTTTPAFYSLLFIIGFIYSLLKVFKDINNFKQRDRAVILFLFLVPLIAPVITGTRLFNGWRHHYFVYPLYVYFILEAIILIINRLKLYENKSVLYSKNLILCSLLILGLLYNVYLIYVYHPYQYTYSNIFAGKDNKYAKYKCTLDYWGVSYKQILEHIVKNDKRKKIRIYSKEKPGRHTKKILKPKDRDRINQYNPEQPFNQEHCIYDLPKNAKEDYAVSVNGNKISVVYRLQEI